MDVILGVCMWRGGSEKVKRQKLCNVLEQITREDYVSYYLVKLIVEWVISELKS